MQKEQTGKRVAACRTQRSDASNTEPDRPAEQQNTTLKQSNLVRKSNRTVKSCRLLEQLRQLNLKKGTDKKDSARLATKKDKENSNCGKNMPMKSLTTSIEGPLMPSQLNLSCHHKLGGVAEGKRHIKTSSNVIPGQSRPATRYEQPLVKPSTVKHKNAVRLLNSKKPQLSMDNFSIGKRLGKGRFGNVYLAQDKTTRFIFAMKVIDIQQCKQAGLQDQLVEQIKLQMFCKHPNILKLYGCFRDQTRIYLLLELGTQCLFRLLRTKKHFTEEQTASNIKQIIESLRYLHSENIIHRDIKPQNILVVEGVLKVADFGWSTYSPIEYIYDLFSKRQTFCGTLDYVPPEIVKGDYYDEKVDIWSLGVLCYQLATGKAPFEVPNDQLGTYDKILSVQLNFPQTVSEGLRDLIQKILVRDPHQRLSLQQIASHLWLQQFGKSGRYISREIWQRWQRFGKSSATTN